MPIQRIAVIGSGISGLSAAYILNQRYDITLFEANSRLGGHSNTVKTSENKMIDTGFIVFNELNYPYFCRFLSKLGVEHCESDMSFAYFDQQNNHYYSSDFPGGLFSQKRNILSPRFYLFIANILRFNRIATADKDTVDPSETVYNYLTRKGFNQKFIHEYVLPMGAAIWSTSQNDVKSFPIKQFISFWTNHCLLQILNRPQWRTIKGGSIEYIRALIKAIDLKYHLNHPIQTIVRTESGVELHGPNGPAFFDAVVIATHADQALKMLATPSQNEAQLLGQWRYSKNDTLLHHSPMVAPPTKKAWASWIYTRGNDDIMSASYYMNRLQNLETDTPYFVTLNSQTQIPSNCIDYQTMYEHPVMDLASMGTQNKLDQLNGHQHTYFCGSYFGNGFHEDGIRSAVHVGKHLECQF